MNRLSPRLFLFFAAATALAMLLVLIIWRGAGIGHPEDETWNRIQETHTLRVGMDASYPPFEDLGADGVITGFDVDLAQEIGRGLGVRVVLVNIAYDGLSDALLSGQVDILISALTTLPQLEGKAWFSMPYFNAGDSLVVGSGSSVRAMADMEGHTLAVEYGSGGDVETRKWERRLSNLTVKRYPLASAAVDAVTGGEADAALVDGIAARLAVGANEQLVLAVYVTDALFVVVAPEDSPALHREINAILEETLQGEVIERITARWFGPG